MRIGDVVSLRAGAFAEGSDTVADLDGYIVFVPGLVPGERARVRIVSASRKFARGEVVSIEHRSRDRIEPRCRWFGECGGCHQQHVAYGAQLDLKRERVRAALRRVCGPGVDVRATIGPADPWEQRTKIGFAVAGPIGEARAGLFRARSRELVAVDACVAQDPRGTALALAAVDELNRLRIEAWDRRTDSGTVRAVVVRSAPGTGQAFVTLVTRREPIPQLDALTSAVLTHGAAGVAVNVNAEDGPLLMGAETRLVAGTERIEDEVCGVRYVMSPGAFFQTSRDGVRILVEQVLAALDDLPADSSILDLYCGVGLFALALARRFPHVLGVEENPAAIEDARAGAERNGLPHAEFVASRAELRIQRVAERRAGRYAAVVLDPPREGCDARVIDAICRRLQPRRVVYVSCDPQSLARDVARFRDHGWELRHAQPIDMFPQVSHVETVAVIEPSASGRPRREPAPRRK